MDLNELLKQHQIALINAEQHGSGQGKSNFCLVGHYAKRIRSLRAELGVRQYQPVL